MAREKKVKFIPSAGDYREPIITYGGDTGRTFEQAQKMLAELSKGTGVVVPNKIDSYRPGGRVIPPEHPGSWISDRINQQIARREEMGLPSLQIPPGQPIKVEITAASTAPPGSDRWASGPRPTYRVISKAKPHYVVGIKGQSGVKKIKGLRGWKLHTVKVPNDSFVKAIYRRGREYREYYVQDIDGKWRVTDGDLREAWTEPRRPRLGVVAKALAWAATVLASGAVGWGLKFVGGE